jgi:hypothetical protein
VCAWRQNAHPLICEVRIFTSSTESGSRPAAAAPYSTAFDNASNAFQLAGSCLLMGTRPTISLFGSALSRFGATGATQGRNTGKRSATRREEIAAPECESPWVLDTRHQRILGSAWSGYPPVAARLKLVVFDDDEHRLPRGAHHRDEKAERDVGAVVGVRVVDYVSAGFPERLAGLDGPRRLPSSSNSISPSST